VEARALIDLRGITFRYDRPRHTLPRSPSFTLTVERLSIMPGERIACIGPSGCGKSTLLHLMCGIEVPQTGVVTLAGSAISTMTDRARRRLRAASVGLVFQEFELLEYLTARENIMLPFLIGEGLSPSREAAERCNALAESLRIAHLLNRHPRRLSQGERQRVAICRALAASPEVILCDEPTGNLDPQSREAVLDMLFQAVPHGSSRALVMVTHDHSVLGRFDRVTDVGAMAARGSNA
jgi:putative ABC transport system ATP-binding protein